MADACAGQQCPLLASLPLCFCVPAYGMWQKGTSKSVFCISQVLRECKLGSSYRSLQSLTLILFSNPCRLKELKSLNTDLQAPRGLVLGDLNGFSSFCFPFKLQISDSF